MHHLVEVPLGPDAELHVDQLWTAGAVGVEERASTIVAAFTDLSQAETAAAAFGVEPTPIDDTAGSTSGANTPP